MAYGLTPSLVSLQTLQLSLRRSGHGARLPTARGVFLNPRLIPRFCLCCDSEDAELASPRPGVSCLAGAGCTRCIQHPSSLGPSREDSRHPVNAIYAPLLGITRSICLHVPGRLARWEATANALGLTLSSLSKFVFMTL